MSSSASSPRKGILFDTNVLSLFAKIKQLPLLLQAFADLHQAKQLYVSPAIQRELETGIRNDASHLQAALQLIRDKDIAVIHPLKSDQQFIHSLPAKLAAGEAEAIALCHRLGLVFISHDRKAINYCERTDISSIKFEVLVDRLKRAGLLTESEINEMLT